MSLGKDFVGLWFISRGNYNFYWWNHKRLERAWQNYRFDTFINTMRPVAESTSPVHTPKEKHDV